MNIPRAVKDCVDPVLRQSGIAVFSNPYSTQAEKTSALYQCLDANSSQTRGHLFTQRESLIRKYMLLFKE